MFAHLASVRVRMIKANSFETEATICFQLLTDGFLQDKRIESFLNRCPTGGVCIYSSKVKTYRWWSWMFRQLLRLFWLVWQLHILENLQLTDSTHVRSQHDWKSEQVYVCCCCRLTHFCTRFICFWSLGTPLVLWSSRNEHIFRLWTDVSVNHRRQTPPPTDDLHTLWQWCVLNLS